MSDGSFSRISPAGKVDKDYCYCVCHSQVSSRPYCKHCKEKFVDNLNNKKYTDDQLIRIGFDYALRSITHNTGNPIDWWKDGFEEPIEEDRIAPIIHSMAERIGLKLIDGMWTET